MGTPLPARPVVLLPAESPARAQIERCLAGEGVVWVAPPRLQDAEVAVIDLSSAAGPDALAQLRAQAAGQRLSVIGVVPCVAPLAEHADLDDVVCLDHLAQELPLRLKQALARHARSLEAQQRERDQALLLKLTADYAESTNAEELLHDVTRMLAEQLGIERAALVVLDEQQGAGFIVAASDDAALKELRIDLSRYPEIREVVRTGKAVIVEDAPSHPLLEGVQAQVQAVGIQNIAALPLAVRGKVLGVLLVRASAKRQAFSRREIDFLATVAHATAVALRNARQIAAIQGISEREKSARIAAEERAAELARYQSYFGALSDGVAILDAKGCVVSLNPAGQKLLDVSAKEAQGRHINALTNPTDDATLLEGFADITWGKTLTDVEARVRTLAGRRLILAVSAAPLREGGAAAILSMRDVTQARQLADELRSTKDFLEKLIDSSVDAIIAADMRGKIILFNKGAEAICGYSAQQALQGVSVNDLYPPGLAKQVMRMLRSDEFGGKGRLTVARQEIITRTGERVPVNMTASILYEGEREVATVGIFTDLRDRIHLERKLSDAETRLEESEKNAVIVALAGAAAHELNQPLTSVMGYAELLKRKLNEGDEVYRRVDIIYREAERMAEIVRKIGKLTRYETMQYVGGKKIIDLDKASSHEE